MPTNPRLPFEDGPASAEATAGKPALPDAADRADVAGPPDGIGAIGGVG